MRLLYLHGFRSSPQSSKAKLMAAKVRAANHKKAGIEWYCPQLPPSPAQAFEIAWNWVAPSDEAARKVPLAVVGSSLGGFYAAALTERLLRAGIYARCVLLNPAPHPARDLSAYIGRVKNWHDEGDFEFTQQHVNELEMIDGKTFTRPERYMAIIAKGDEVLKWREMTKRFPAGTMRLLEGGDHAISDFEMYVDEVLAFCHA
jgi:predicted esterase YcpF (UPF0227 family)